MGSLGWRGGSGVGGRVARVGVGSALPIWELGRALGREEGVECSGQSQGTPAGSSLVSVPGMRGENWLWVGRVARLVGAGV